jgi:hypothetical protein
MHAVTCVVVAISVLDNLIAAGQHLAGTQADTELPTGYAWLIFPERAGARDASDRWSRPRDRPDRDDAPESASARPWRSPSCDRAA